MSTGFVRRVFLSANDMDLTPFLGKQGPGVQKVRVAPVYKENKIMNDVCGISAICENAVISASLENGEETTTR